jgi:hypothetical protein
MIAGAVISDHPSNDTLLRVGMPRCASDYLAGFIVRININDVIGVHLGTNGYKNPQN